MSSILTPVDSPLNRTNRLPATAFRGDPALSPSQQQQLAKLLAEPPSYMDHPSFHEADAEQAIFHDAPAIPAASTGWYHPGGLAEDERRSDSPNVVLTQPQERAIFLQFNYARFRTAILCETLREQEAEPDSHTARHLLRWHALAMRLRDQIAATNLALVLAMARKARHLNVDSADIISEGNFVLLRAIDKFDVSRGFKFSTYACQSILKALSRLAKQHSRHRERFPVEYDPTLAAGGPHDTTGDDREADFADELRRIVTTNRAELTETEHIVITHRFALSDGSEQAPLTRALKKLRQTLENTFIDGFPTAAALPRRARLRTHGSSRHL